MEGVGGRKRRAGWRPVLLALSMYCICGCCVTWLCLCGSEADATVPWTFDTSYHNTEMTEVLLHCLSWYELESRSCTVERGGGGEGVCAAASCKSPRSCQWRCSWFRTLHWWLQWSYNDMTTMTEQLCVLYPGFLIGIELKIIML